MVSKHSEQAKTTRLINHLTGKRCAEQLVQLSYVAETSDDFCPHLSITLYTECIDHLQHQHMSTDQLSDEFNTRY